MFPALVARAQRSHLALAGFDQLVRLGLDTTVDVVHEAVHDGHALLGDASVGVNLLENLVDVAVEGLRVLLALLGRVTFLGGSLGSLLRDSGFSHSYCEGFGE